MKIRVIRKREIRQEKAKGGQHRQWQERWIVSRMPRCQFQLCDQGLDSPLTSAGLRVLLWETKGSDERPSKVIVMPPCETDSGCSGGCGGARLGGCS